MLSALLPPAATKAGGALSGLMSQIMTLEQTQQQALLDMLEQLERIARPGSLGLGIK